MVQNIIFTIISLQDVYINLRNIQNTQLITMAICATNISGLGIIITSYILKCEYRKLCIIVET